MLRRATVFPPDHNLYVAATTREMVVAQSHRQTTGSGACIDAVYGTSDFVQVTAVGNIYTQYPPPYSLR